VVLNAKEEKERIFAYKTFAVCEEVDILNCTL
jgi:hypothetical protein